eukprot:14594049-Heterocapsa_arctica.AAC.1
MDHRETLPERRGVRPGLLARRRRDRALLRLQSRQGRRMEGPAVGQGLPGAQTRDAERPSIRQQRGADEMVPAQLRGLHDYDRSSRPTRRTTQLRGRGSANLPTRSTRC